MMLPYFSRVGLGF